MGPSPQQVPLQLQVRVRRCWLVLKYPCWAASLTGAGGWTDYPTHRTAAVHRQSPHTVLRSA